MVLGIIIQAIRKIAEWRPSVNTRCVFLVLVCAIPGAVFTYFHDILPFQRAEESRIELVRDMDPTPIDDNYGTVIAYTVGGSYSRTFVVSISRDLTPKQVDDIARIYVSNDGSGLAQDLWTRGFKFVEVHSANGNVAIGVLQQLGPPKVKAQKSQPDDMTRAETDNGPVGHMDDDDNVTIPPGMCVPPGAEVLKEHLDAPCITQEILNRAKELSKRSAGKKCLPAGPWATFAGGGCDPNAVETVPVNPAAGNEERI